MKTWNKPEIMSLNFRHTQGEIDGEGDDLLLRDNKEFGLDHNRPTTSPPRS